MKLAPTPTPVEADDLSRDDWDILVALAGLESDGRRTWFPV